MSFARMQETVVVDLEWFLINLVDLNRSENEFSILKKYSNIEYLKKLMKGLGGKERIEGGISWPKFKSLVETLLAVKESKKDQYQ